MDEKPVILFDLDGTLCDYEGQLCSDLEQMRSPDEPVITRDNIHAAHWEPWIEARIHAIKRQPDWWIALPRFQLGWDILAMAEPLFAIHILTKGPSTFMDAWRQKGEWVRRNMFMPVCIHVTEEKRGCYGRVLVDDYTDYVTNWLKDRPRGLVVMPANAGNKNFAHPNVIRYDGSKDSYFLVSNALHAAAQREERQHWRELMPAGLLPEDFNL